MTRASGAGTFPPCPLTVPSPRQVPQRSPLRYPGGKSRLIPHLRAWLAARARETGGPPRHLVEPFAGGGIIAITTAAENLAHHVVMGDSDPEIAHLWRTALDRGDALAKAVRAHRPDREPPPGDDRNPVLRALGTLVRNRTTYNGDLTRHGGRSTPEHYRWYGSTIAERVTGVHALRSRITFRRADWTETAGPYRDDPDAVLFIDPPYRRRGKHRLYSHGRVDHESLFAFLSAARNDFMMTCEDCGETASLVRAHGFTAVSVNMRNGAHRESRELLITRSAVFTREAGAAERRR